MNRDYSRSDLPVIVLYNLDPAWPEEDIRDCRASSQLLVESLAEVGHPVQEVCIQSAELKTALEGYSPIQYLIFNWCEELPGIPRSGFLVAQSLEQMGFTYTGASAQALALSQDKRQVKSRLRAQGIPTPRWQIYTNDSRDGWDCFPAIVKPVFEHCSIGVTRDAVVESPQELTDRVRYVLETFGQPALIEEFIDGREFHITVLGNSNIFALPTAEMDFSAFDDVKDRLCTFESKFDLHSKPYNLIELRLPAPLTQDEQDQIEAIALGAYRALGCRDYARMDLRLKDGTFYMLDVNPNADFSPDTSLALAADIAGLPYGKLGSFLVNLAAQRHGSYSSEAENEVSGLPEMQ